MIDSYVKKTAKRNEKTIMVLIDLLINDKTYTTTVYFMMYLYMSLLEAHKIAEVILKLGAYKIANILKFLTQKVKTLISESSC